MCHCVHVTKRVLLLLFKQSRFVCLFSAPSGDLQRFPVI